jgi:hypothetical protein
MKRALPAIAEQGSEERIYKQFRADFAAGHYTSETDTSTDSQLTQSATSDETHDAGPTMNEMLTGIEVQGRFWVEKIDTCAPAFPILGSSVEHDVQPFFATVMDQYRRICESDHMVYAPDPVTGHYTSRAPLNYSYHSDDCVPVAHEHNAHSADFPTPVVNVYYKTANVECEACVVSSWVLVDRAVSDATPVDDADLSKLGYYQPGPHAGTALSHVHAGRVVGRLPVSSVPGLPGYHAGQQL